MPVSLPNLLDKKHAYQKNKSRERVCGALVAHLSRDTILPLINGGLDLLRAMSLKDGRIVIGTIHIARICEPSTLPLHIPWRVKRIASKGSLDP